MLRAAEDERRPCPRFLEEPYQHLKLVLAIDLHHDVIDIGLVAVFLIRSQNLRFSEVLGRDLFDPRRISSRKEGRLPAARRHRQDALDVGREAPVEHLVGLIQHQHLHSVES